MIRRVTLLAILAACTLAPVVRAQPDESKRTAEEARALFRKGDYRGSLDALERLQRIAPDPRLFWNMAACENKLGHHAKAIAYVERYVAAIPALSAEEKTSATQFLSAARAYVGTVTIASNIDGTEVTIDDEVLGKTPLAKPILLDEGEHRVRFARDRHKTVDRTERVTGGSDLRWSVELEPIAPAPKPVVEVARRPSRLGPILVGGTGIVLAGVGGVLVGLSLDKASQLRADCGTMCPPSRWESYRTMQTAGDVMLVAGGAAVASAVVWWMLQPGPRRTESAWIAPAIGGLVVGGTL
jgi:hypothetical protein